MSKFKRAIVRTPCRAMVSGITSADLGTPDYDLALVQHQNYIQALQHCGVEVEVLPADERFPDSTFVEDVALLTPSCAIITNPGAPSRNGETEIIRPAVEKYYSVFEKIEGPGTIDAGDIMCVGNHYYIGLSDRTNREGAGQMTTILEKYGMTASSVKLETMLHLKTGVNYLENNSMLITGEFTSRDEFQQFECLEVLTDEAYAANSLWVNDFVITPKGFPQTKSLLQQKGFNLIEVDVSEFQKLDGGLSCLSLRF